jgi:hypothetical protein
LQTIVAWQPMPPESAFRHLVPQSGIGEFRHLVTQSGIEAFRYRTGYPYSGNALFPASVFLFIPVSDWLDAGQSSILGICKTFTKVKKKTNSLHSDGLGYTLHVHTARDGQGYSRTSILLVVERDTTVTSLLLAVERDTRIHNAHPYCTAGGETDTTQGCQVFFFLKCLVARCHSFWFIFTLIEQSYNIYI